MLQSSNPCSLSPITASSSRFWSYHVLWHLCNLMIAYYCYFECSFSVWQWLAFMFVNLNLMDDYIIYFLVVTLLFYLKKCHCLLNKIELITDYLYFTHLVYIS
ncbi:hypothetical protein AAHE18_15G190200 [Arachis hypogaea]